MAYASIEGSGDLNLEGLHQDEIELEITGSGTIRASGEVVRLVVRISGSDDIKAQATQSLSARVSGSGEIKVWGDPAKRDTRVSGSGDIRFR